MTKKEFERAKEITRETVLGIFPPGTPDSERLAHAVRMNWACSTRYFGSWTPEEVHELNAYAKEVWEEFYGTGKTL